MIMFIDIMFIKWTPPYIGYDLQLIMFSLTYVHDVLIFLTEYSYTHYPTIMFLQVMQQGLYMSQRLHSD